MTPVTEEPDTGTAVPTKSTAEELGERLMETADTMAHDMGIPTAALIAIIVGKYILLLVRKSSWIMITMVTLKYAVCKP
jgi:hypothetical protein